MDEAENVGEEGPDLKRSDRFCDENAEVTFKSSDKVIFKIHKAKLDATSGGFAAPQGADFSESVTLTEDAATLELLFRFVYPHQTPALGSLEFPVLDALSEAAEKYQVYPAMDLCFLHMRDARNAHPLKAFAYAARHGYDELASETAPSLVQEKIEDVLAVLPPTYVLPWAKYQSQWSQVVQNALTTHVVELDQSRLSIGDYAAIVSKLSASLGSLQNLDDVFPPGSSAEVMKWRKLVEDDVLKMPEFNDYLKGSEKTGESLTLNTVTTEEEEEEEEETEDDEDSRRQAGDDATFKPAKEEADPLFQDADADVLYKSRDGTTFRVHRNYIAAMACTLPLPEIADPETTIELDENSGTMNDLLRYIYPTPKLNITLWMIEYLEPLAYAAEKYKISAAIAVCNYHMKRRLHENSSLVFKYAFIHGYRDMMDEAAPLMISGDFLAAAKYLPSTALKPWLEYYELWRQVAHKGQRYTKKFPSFGTGCTKCGKIISGDSMEIVYRLGEGAHHLADLDKLFDVSSGGYCCELHVTRWEKWRRNLQEKIDLIPKFTTFLPVDEEPAPQSE